MGTTLCDAESSSSDLRNAEDFAHYRALILHIDNKQEAGNEDILSWWHRADASISCKTSEYWLMLQVAGLLGLLGLLALLGLLVLLVVREVLTPVAVSSSLCDFASSLAYLGGKLDIVSSPQLEVGRGSGCIL